MGAERFRLEEEAKGDGVELGSWKGGLVAAGEAAKVWLFGGIGRWGMEGERAAFRRCSRQILPRQWSLVGRVAR
jgi:hypothetical protein